MISRCFRIRFSRIAIATRLFSDSAKKRVFNQNKTKVPLTPTKQNTATLPPRTSIDQPTIALLERLSLVDFGDDKGIKIVEDAVRFADNILHIDTEGVEPMYTVLEDRNLSLRGDEVTDGNCRDDILRNASVTEEDYFVAPPGNIPLSTKEPGEKK